MNQCPACDHSFTKLEDFPLIYVAEFKKVELPEYIGIHINSVPEKRPARIKLARNVGQNVLMHNSDIPPKVLKALREGKEVVSEEGYIYRKSVSEGYVDKSQDVTAVVNRVVTSSPFRSTLSALESFVGNEVETKELLARLKLNDSEKYKDFELELYEDEPDSRGNRCKINLCGCWEFTRAYPPLPGLRKTVGELTYEGRIRH